MNQVLRDQRGMILSAFRVEVEAIASRLSHAGTLKKEGALTFLTGRVDDRELLVGTTGMGKVCAAAAVQKAIDLFQPGFLIFCGTAGALAPQVNPLDLVVAESLLQHDTGPEPPHPVEADERITVHLIASAEAVVLGRDHAVYRGRMLTGDRPILKACIREGLYQKHGALAVDMESAAALWVAQKNGIPAGAIKAVTDSADRDGIRDFKKNVARAAALVQRAVNLFLGFDANSL